ncbi:carboxypeptidase regulatory-like domain-containing protein [Sphingobacterium spiritivorum]|uniref:carboxypeptidase regulatory-like domain-containing protein n=1 Tax=Sphingobacterium spiritivorum TaxID=258 RepID=UPI003DA42636
MQLKSTVTALFLFVIMFLLRPADIWAQETGRIEGKLTNSKQHPLADVVLILNNGLQTTISDATGQYHFDNLRDGHYTIKATYFDTAEEKKIKIEGGKRIRLDFVLGHQIRQLDSVSVSVNRKSIPSSTLRLSENLLVTPQNIVVIDQQLIYDQIILSTAEGFTKNISGARTIYHQEEGSVGIAVRGYTASNLRNGMDVSGSFGPLREDMAFVERIEFVKGPAGFMMGNTQPGGFYNVVTKTPKGNGANAAQLTLGSFGLYRAQVDIDSKLSKDGKFLGRFNLMGTKKGSHMMNVSNEQFVLNPSFRYIASDKTDLTFEYIYSQNNFTGGFAKYAYGLKGFKELPRSFNFGDPILDPTVVKEHNIFGTVNHLISDNWMLTAKFGYINSAMEGESLYARYNTIDSTGSVDRGLNINDALNTSTVGQVFTKGKFNIGSVQNNVLIGLDMGSKFYVADWSEVPGLVGGKFNIYNPVFGNLTKSNLPAYDRSKPLRERGASTLTEYTYYSVHFQEEMHLLSDKLRLGAGVRYTTTSKISKASDGKRVNNKALTPRFSITGILRPDLTVYALYDQSFQEQVGTQVNGDPADPSRGINTEAGLKKTWFGGSLMTGVTAYRLTRTNVLTSAGPDRPNLVEQSGEATSKGIEVDINGKIDRSWNIMLNYAYTDAKISRDNDAAKIGQMLYGTARHIANSWLTYTVQDGGFRGLGVSTGFELQTKRAAWPVTKEKYLPDNFFSIDAGMSYKRDNYNLALVVNNVTNRYNYVGFYPGAWGYKHYGWRAMPPTNFRLSLGYSF